MHSVRVPINVRCYSNSAIIIRRSAVTLRANKRLMHRNMIARHNQKGCHATVLLIVELCRAFSRYTSLHQRHPVSLPYMGYSLN